MVRVRYSLPTMALAAVAAFTASTVFSRGAQACDKAQCPLTVSTEPTGPAPQPLAAGEAPTVAPMKLDRFRRRAASGKVYQADRAGSKKVASSKSTKRSIVAHRAKAGQRSRVAAAPTQAEDEVETTVAAPTKSKRIPVAAAAATLPAGPVLASADSGELNTASDVKVVSPDEVNEIDLAAGPVPADAVVTTVTPTPVDAPRAVETTGRASSLDSIQRELASHTTADSPSAPDETWLRKMLLVLGGAFAAAAAAARLLMTA